MTELEYLKKYYKGNIEDAIKRLDNGEPVQYIVGDVDFYGNILKVDKRVLIPRPETEELVEKTLKIIKDRFYGNIDILDLGTGSGCIPITLKKELPNANVSAIDISLDALEVAKENATINKVDINFIHSDMFDNATGRYDVIISNPPYIRCDEKIMNIVKNNEPHLALYAKDRGLYFYDNILQNCSNYLKDNFLIAFEIGEEQGAEVVDLANKYLNNIEVIVKKDFRKLDRFVFIMHRK